MGMAVTVCLLFKTTYTEEVPGIEQELVLGGNSRRVPSIRSGAGLAAAGGIRAQPPLGHCEPTTS